MNLTVISEPATKFVSVNRPISFTCETERCDTTVSMSIADTDCSNSSGCLKISNISTGNLAKLNVNDIIEISGFTDTADLWLNGKCQITNITPGTPNYIITDLAWVGALTTDTGTLELSNDNFQLRSWAEISSVDYPALQKFMNSSLQATFDLQKVIKQFYIDGTAEFPSIGSPALANNGLRCFLFCALFQERYDDAEGLQIAGDSEYSSNFIACGMSLQQWLNESNTTITNYKILASTDTGKKFLSNRTGSRRVRSGDMDLLAIYVDNATEGSAYQWLFNIKRYNASGGLLNASNTVFTIPDGTYKKIFIICHSTCNFTYTGQSYFTVQILDATGLNAITELITYIIETGTIDAVRAVWENNRDGFDSYTFRASQENIEITKSFFRRDYADNTTREDLTAYVEAKESKTPESLPTNDFDYLKEMLYSRDVRIYDLTTGLYTFVTVEAMKGITSDRKLITLKPAFNMPMRNIL